MAPSDHVSGDRPGLALVTGASSGIGRALAEQLVDRGYDVVVTGRSDAVHAAADALRARRPDREVHPVRADLAHPEGVELLWGEVTGRGEDLAVAALNAGVGVGGTFAGSDLARHLELVDLNVRSTVHLAGLAVDHMAARRSGRILVTASVAAVAPSPYQATYAASKAFVHSFAEGIAQELRGSGVTVTSLMPGPTDTRFFDRAGLADAPIARGRKDDPGDVARDAVDALLAGKRHVRAGSLRTAVLAEVLTHLPDAIGSRAMGLQSRPRRR
ncbi:SDR family NAD(P)-dependent oxidoreductase [Nocardioides sp. CPCC 205120]|uniref:SDR family NAD(P)-dependent oxidoreductase n=1 Tax=Nocardioides sp. CPCC 205120 TaxID=3406462 RepID=UPI003B500AAF